MLNKSLNTRRFASALQYPRRDNSRKFPEALSSRTIANSSQHRGGSMDRRESPRVEVQLPVQVWGLDAYGQPFTDPAVVTNMSTGGLVLQGIRRRIRAGELLDIRMGEERAQFRVVWVGGAGTRRAGELGM